MKLQSYNSFWQRIHKSAKEKGFPLRVMFELTYRCNFKCKHCYVPESYRRKCSRELKTKEILSILDQLQDLGCFYLGFTGGEPFLREDIFDILWYAKKRGFELIIYSNGSLIDKKTALELGRLRPNKVDITIPAMSRAAFERITDVGGCRDKVFNAINLLYKKGVNLGFKTCVLKENKSEIEDIRNFAHSLGALHRLDDILSPRLDGNKEPYRYRGNLEEYQLTARSLQLAGNDNYLIPTDCRQIDCDYRLSVSGRRKKTYPVPNVSYAVRRTPYAVRLFKCGVGVSQAAITPFGELKMCLMIDYPKYKILNKQVSGIRYQVSGRENGLEEAWLKLKKLVTEIHPDENYQCDKCQFYDYCKWCPGKAWLYNRSFTSCEPESRYWAEQKRKEYENRG